MDHLRRGNRELIKDINRALVVDQVRTKGPLSRTDIARNTKLGLSTVTKIVDGLIGEHLVQEVGEGDSSGGRRPIFIGFNYGYGYIIGVKIERQQVIFAVTDLSPKVRKKINLPFAVGESPEQVIELIDNGISRLIAEYEHRNLPCLGIGIGISGLVDKEAGVLLSSSFLGWGRTDFRTILRDRFSVPVFIDNDVNVYTLAELCYGHGQRVKNFVLVSIGVGVGAGLVQNGQLYRGEFGGAGEVGHAVLYPGGNPCVCGQRGCLETYVGDGFIIDETKRLLSREKDSTLYERRLNLRMPDILDAAHAGDYCARRALAAAGRNLGLGLVNLVNTLNPGAVVLAGEGLAGKEFIVPAAAEIVGHNFFKAHQPSVQLLVSELGDDAWEIGAATMALNELFQEPIYRNRREMRLII